MNFVETNVGDLVGKYVNRKKESMVVEVRNGEV